MEPRGIPITDPVELAWCEFARHREKTWRAITTGEQGLSIASFEAGAKWQAARIRRELKTALAACFSTQRDLNAEKVIDALDRIIPEER